MAEYLDREAFKKSIEERYCKPCKAEGEDHNECWCRACGINDMLDEVDCFQSSKVVSLHDIYRVIAGHSYYHGDCILSALTCITEGKEVNPVQPTDLVFLRRCKDCRYFENATVNSKGFLICHITGMDITPEDYCSYSETKKDLKIKQMTGE